MRKISKLSRSDQSKEGTSCSANARFGESRIADKTKATAFSNGNLKQEKKELKLQYIKF